MTDFAPTLSHIRDAWLEVRLRQVPWLGVRADEEFWAVIEQVRRGEA